MCRDTVCQEDRNLLSVGRCQEENLGLVKRYARVSAMNNAMPGRRNMPGSISGGQGNVKCGDIGRMSSAKWFIVMWVDICPVGNNQSVRRHRMLSTKYVDICHVD